MFLVMICYSFDDIPVRLFGTFDEAIEFAGRLEEADEETCRVLQIHSLDEPEFVRVVEFRDGRPVKDWMPKRFATTLF